MRFLTKKILAATLALALGSYAYLPEAQADAADGTPHTLNLKDVDITVLIATVSEITGKTFVVDPAVSGKVNVVSNQPLNKAELYQMFLSVLRVHGFSAIETGTAIRIVPEAKAAQDGAVGLGAALSDEMVTRIIQLKHVSPSEMVQILGPLKSPSAQLMAHNSSSSLVVADRSSNVSRMLEIIRRIDQASQSDIEMVPLSNANATEVVRTINGLQQSTDSTNKVVADERTNSILLAGDRSRRLKLRAVIASLDVPLTGSDTMEVVYLRYADATQLVGILEGVLRGSRDPAGASLPGSVPGVGGANLPVAQAAATVIQAHKETNSLIITAPPAVLRELKDLVRKLDIRRAQVLIEAMIVEVTDDQAKQLGIQWQATDDDFNDRGFIGGTNYPQPGPGIVNTQVGLATPQGLAALGGSGGLNLGYILGSVKFPGSKDSTVQLGALANALSTDGGGNVLSQPSTMALDHQKAMLSVGQEVPFLTGRYQTGASTGGFGTDPNTGGQTSGVVNPFQTIDRKEVGLKLEVTPHINEGTAVRMDINIEISSLAANVSGASDLITNTRKLSTQAIVRDGGLLVLGGLTSNEARQSENRVPGLGRIPILGELFKSRSIDTRRRNLLVFLKPTIARDAMTEDVISYGKYNQIREQQIDARDNRSWLMPESGTPVMPDLKSYLEETKPNSTPKASLDQSPPNPMAVPEAMRQELTPIAPPMRIERRETTLEKPVTKPVPKTSTEHVPDREVYAPASPIRVRPEDQK